jgi:drug/metabolite transporter (DMT)-like permease
MLAVIAGLLPGFGAYQAHLYVQRELGPARASLVLYLGPVWAAIFGWLWLDELPQWYHYVAGGMILPGIFLATRGGPKAPARATAAPRTASARPGP